MIGVFLAVCHLFFSFAGLFRYLSRKASITSSEVTADGIGDVINSNLITEVSSADVSLATDKTTWGEQTFEKSTIGSRPRSIVGSRKKYLPPNWPAAPQIDVCMTADYGPIPWREAVSERAASVPALLGFGAFAGGYPGYNYGMSIHGIQGQGMSPQPVSAYGMEYGMDYGMDYGYGLTPGVSINDGYVPQILDIGYPQYGGSIPLSMTGYPPPNTMTQNMVNPIQADRSRHNVYCSGPAAFVYPQPLPGITSGYELVQTGVPSTTTHGTQVACVTGYRMAPSTVGGKSIMTMTTPTTSCGQHGLTFKSGNGRKTLTPRQSITPQSEQETSPDEIPSYTRSRRTRTSAAKSASLIPAQKCGKSIGFDDSASIGKSSTKSKHLISTPPKSLKSRSIVEHRGLEYSTTFIPSPSTVSKTLASGNLSSKLGGKCASTTRGTMTALSSKHESKSNVPSTSIAKPPHYSPSTFPSVCTQTVPPSIRSGAQTPSSAPNYGYSPTFTNTTGIGQYQMPSPYGVNTLGQVSQMTPSSGVPCLGQCQVASGQVDSGMVQPLKPQPLQSVQPQQLLQPLQTLQSLQPLQPLQSLQPLQQLQQLQQQQLQQLQQPPTPPQSYTGAIPLGPASQSHVQWESCTNFDEGFDPATAPLPRRPAAM